MRDFWKKYQYAAIAAVFILAGGLFVLRDGISGLLYFGSENPPAPAAEEKFGVSDDNETAPVDGSASPDVRKSAVMTPSYTGRDPEEVKPRPDDVQIFSEEQKKQIYAEIGNNGNAVKKNPDFFHGWLQLGLLKKTIGDFKGAADAWEYAGLIRPQNAVSFANLGELYWRYLPDYPRAEKNFRVAIQNKPDDTGTYVSLSDLYYYSYKEKQQLADDVLMEGITARPTEAVNLKRALAALYERAGDREKAIVWWKKVLEEEPDNADVAAAIAALEKTQ